MEELLKAFMDEMRDFRSDVKDRFSRLEEGQERLEVDVAGLKDGQQRLESDVSVIKGVVTNNLTEARNYMKQLEFIQARQNRIIEILSARSLSHEANIQDLKTTVQKWGNSLGVRIPKAIAMKVGLEEGSEIDFDVQEDKIIIKCKRQKLKDLLSEITTDNIHKEVSTGDTEGRELW
jgi:antitoxin MazE